METLLEITLCAGWTAIFLILIAKLPFFKTEKLPVTWFQGAFLLKIVFGFLLWAVYTFYYTDRATADIYKYFDDSLPIFQALFINPVHYLKMVSGIGADDPVLHQYYQHTLNWYHVYDSTLYNDTRNIIRFNAIVRLFSLGFYNVHTIFMCFISLIGLTALYKTFEPIVKNRETWLFAALFLVPSVLFWGSGVLKEGILFFGMGMLIYHFHRLIDKEVRGGKWINLIWVLLMTVLVAITKFYIFAALLPGLMVNFWLSRGNEKKPLLKYAIVLGVMLTIGLTVHLYTPLPNPLKVLAHKQTDFINLVKGGVYFERELNGNRDTIYVAPEYYDQVTIDAHKDEVVLHEVEEWQHYENGELADVEQLYPKTQGPFKLLRDFGRVGHPIALTPLEPNIWGLMKAMPRAYYNAVFRPWLFESKSPLILVSALENTALLLILIFALIKASWKKENSKWIFFCLSFSLILYGLSGLITPVLGALVRYRIPAIPFLLIIAILLIKENPLSKSSKGSSLSN